MSVKMFMSTDIENQLTELSCDNKLKQIFKKISVEVYWAYLYVGRN